MEKISEKKRAEFESALADFGNSLEIDSSVYDSAVGDLISSGKIQKFEVCAELLWKTMKLFLLEQYGVDLASPKPVIKAFYNNGLCDNEEYELMLEIIDERNRLSHLYRKSMIIPILGRLGDYHVVMKKCCMVMISVE